MKYEIWQDNGVSTIFEYDSDDFDEVLNAFCAEAGYIDHSNVNAKAGFYVVFNDYTTYQEWKNCGHVK